MTGDNVTVSFRTGLVPLAPAWLDQLRQGLQRLGQLKSSRSRTRLQGSFDRCPTSQAVVHFDLRVTWADGAAVARLDGAFWANSQVAARERVGTAQELVGLDRRRNVSVSTDELASRLPDHASEVVEDLDRCAGKLVAIAAGVGTITDAAVALREVEITRDLHLPGAVGVAHRLQASSPPGALHLERNSYADSRSEHAGRLTSVRFQQTRSGPRGKGYAKLAEIFRMELCFDRNALVAADVGAEWMAPGSGGLTRAFEEVAAWARAPLARLEGHVRAVAASTATPYQLAVALLPLVTAGLDDRRRRGRKAETALRERVAAAYDELVLTGRVAPTAEKAHGPLRQLLDGLAASGTLVRDEGTRVLYRLDARWAAALTAGSSSPDRGSDPGICAKRPRRESVLQPRRITAPPRARKEVS